MRSSEFFAQVPQLFPKANRRIWESYEETLFGMRRPITHGNYWAVRRYVGGNPPQAAIADPRINHELERILSRARYPDASPLGLLEDFTEGSTEFASALLHFYNPAYPIYDDATVRGLGRLGVDVEFTARLDEGAVDQYQATIDAIQELKEGIPFYHVPERNYYLTRIIQESLWELGLESPAPASPRTAQSHRGPPKE